MSLGTLLAFLVLLAMLATFLLPLPEWLVRACVAMLALALLTGRVILFRGPVVES